MDPMTALGLASNIIQLISFTSDIISKSREIYKSQDGKLVEHMELEAITSSLQDLNNGILFPFQPGSQVSKIDENLRELCTGCNDVSQRLVSAIQALQVRGTKSNRRWDSFRQALKTIWKEDEIEALSRRLDRYRTQIDTTLLASLTIALQEQVEQQLPMEKVHSKKRLQGSGSEETEQWAAELMEATRQHHDVLRNQQDMAWFSNRVSAATVAQRRELQKARILEKLRFTNMGDRYERIEGAYKKTLEWIFHDNRYVLETSTSLRSENLGSPMEQAPLIEGGKGFGTGSDVEGEQPRWSSFVHWLQGNESLYWITGKPGSGKSTLMKYLYNDDRTLRCLRRWTGNSLPVMAGFFFWNSGTAMQMSRIGLLQALLYQSIQGQMDLVPVLFPERWNSYELFGGDLHPWSWSELSRAFDILVSDTSRKCIFFVDGLDEFDGDCAELANFVLDNSAKPNIKFCVASRPWLVFEDAFQQIPSLRLEDLTAPDMHLFASESLHKNTMFNYLEKLQPEEASRLITEVTDKASGVFLWVRLVVSSLLEGLRDGDDISDLHARLLALPADLEQLFLKILNSLNPQYFEQASKLFQYVRAAKSPLSLLSLSFADDGFEKAFTAEVNTMEVREMEFRVEMMRRRLSSRCKGLIDAPAHKHEGRYAEVQYLHKTVKDFLENPQIWAHVVSGTSDSFDPDLMLCGAFLRQIKAIDMQHRSNLKVFVEQFFEYSVRLQHTAIQSHVSSLKELDRAVILLVGHAKPSPYHRTHWSALLEEPGNSSASSFFEYAFKHPFYDYVESELKGGHSADSQINRKSLLYIAVESGDIRMMEILLAYGADPNALQSTGFTTWYHALEKSSNDMGKLLLEEAKDHPISLGQLLSVSIWATRITDWANTIQTFLEHHADPRILLEQDTPLDRWIVKVFGAWDQKLTKDLLEILDVAKKSHKTSKQISSNRKSLSPKWNSTGVRSVFRKLSNRNPKIS